MNEQERSSDSSGMILFLFSSCRLPAAENNLSDGTEVGGADKNGQASYERIENDQSDGKNHFTGLLTVLKCLTKSRLSWFELQF